MFWLNRVTPMFVLQIINAIEQMEVPPLYIVHHMVMLILLRSRLVRVLMAVQAQQICQLYVSG